jgi:hypothetical protein
MEYFVNINKKLVHLVIFVNLMLYVQFEYLSGRICSPSEIAIDDWMKATAYRAIEYYYNNYYVIIEFYSIVMNGLECDTAAVDSLII